MMSEMLKNPEMMKMASEMLKNNPGLMENIMKNGFGPKKDNLEATPFKLDDTVNISGLSKDEYNNKLGSIKSYNSDKSRFEVYVNDLNKSLYLKELNLTKVNEDEPIVEDVSIVEEIDT